MTGERLASTVHTYGLGTLTLAELPVLQCRDADVGEGELGGGGVKWGRR